MSQPSRSSGAVLMAAGLGVAGYCLRHVLRAIASGTTPGRMGAVHAAPEAEYFVSLLGGGVGAALGLVCVYRGWRWLFPPP